MTNKKWVYTKQDKNYKPKKNEYAIRRWVNGNNNHFNMADFDSLSKSITVEKGYIESYRIFRLA